jgi:hypothetical protein
MCRKAYIIHFNRSPRNDRIPTLPRGRSRGISFLGLTQVTAPVCGVGAAAAPSASSNRACPIRPNDRHDREVQDTTNT